MLSSNEPFFNPNTVGYVPTGYSVQIFILKGTQEIPQRAVQKRKGKNTNTLTEELKRTGIVANRKQLFVTKQQTLNAPFVAFSDRSALDIV